MINNFFVLVYRLIANKTVLVIQPLINIIKAIFILKYLLNNIIYKIKKYIFIK